MPNCLCPLKNAARDAPNLIAILGKGFSLTFSELDQAADTYRAELQRIGLAAGHRIVTYHPTDWRLIAFFFAVWRLGASICPLNLRLPPLQISDSLSRLSPALYLTDLSLPFQPLRPIPSSSFSSLFLFTSGTTGIPKIAVHSLNSLLTNASSAVSGLDLQPNDQWLLSLPLFHVGGIGTLLRCILARATLVLDERSPQITHLSYVPSQLYRAWPTYRNLRCLLLGGAPIHAFPSCLPLYATYGLTEMGSIVTVGRKPNSMHLLSGREIKIAEDGEILVRGPCLFQGYWEQDRIHLPIDEQGWFATKDIGRFCPKEGFAILGRKDWQFISGGENIQPEEIELELLRLPEIIDAAVIALPDAEFGQRPAAVIQTRFSNYTLHQMQSALKPRLPKFKIPIALFIFDEIPKNGLKTDRKKIFELVTRELLN